MNFDRVTEYFNSLDEQGKNDYIKNTAQNVSKLCKQKNKALERELNTPTHSSREIRTTVYANSQKISKLYFDEVATLKHIMKLLC
jgi:hypothetical protein